MKWRISVLLIITGLLAVLSFSEIKEFGNDLKYPAESAVNITSYSQERDKTSVITELEKFAKEQDLVLFKPIYTNNHQSTFVLVMHLDGCPIQMEIIHKINNYYLIQN